MLRRLSIACATAMVFVLIASDALARNPNYYGTRRHTSARVYSGEYQARRPNVVPTFSLPSYGAGFRTYRRGGFYGGFRPIYPIYQQPVVIYPPAVYYGF